MKLLTQALLKAFEKQGDTSDMDPKDIKIIAKFFNPAGAGTWYATEYDPLSRIFFGFVSLYNDHNDELGAFLLDDLEELQLPMGLHIERDQYFGEHMLSEVLDGARP